MKMMQNIQEDITIEYMGRIYAALKDRQAEYQSNMIKVKGTIINHNFVILIDLGASHCSLIIK
jgi:hypothetical protein